MAQTTAALSAKNVVIKLNSADISGSANKVTLTRKKLIGKTYTFDGDYAIAVSGKSDWTVVITAVYTETQNEAMDALADAYESGQAVSLEIQPKGTGSGNWKFTGNVVIGEHPIPLDAGSGDPVLVEFTCEGTGTLTRGTQS